MSSPSYTLLPSAFGVLAIVWQGTSQEPKVWRVLLPADHTEVNRMLQASFPDASVASCPPIAELGRRIQRFLDGQPVDFALGIVAFERCSAFQRRVLLAEHRIPRGWVSTYGRIARSLGIPRGSRAVGRALARNPFPIIVPCHRAVKSDGSLSGFQGGARMKRALLELEGVEFSAAGKVRMDKVYY